MTANDLPVEYFTQDLVLELNAAHEIDNDLSVRADVTRANVKKILGARAALEKAGFDQARAKEIAENMVSPEVKLLGKSPLGVFKTTSRDVSPEQVQKRREKRIKSAAAILMQLPVGYEFSRAEIEMIDHLLDDLASAQSYTNLHRGLEVVLNRWFEKGEVSFENETERYLITNTYAPTPTSLMQQVRKILGFGALVALLSACGVKSVDHAPAVPLEKREFMDIPVVQEKRPVGFYVTTNMVRVEEIYDETVGMTQIALGNGRSADAIMVSTVRIFPVRWTPRFACCVHGQRQELKRF